MVYQLIAEKLSVLKQHRKKISTDNTNKINVLKNELATIKKQQDKLMDMCNDIIANLSAEEKDTLCRILSEDIYSYHEEYKNKKEN